jgi:hypothetical protein
MRRIVKLGTVLFFVLLSIAIAAPAAAAPNALHCGPYVQTGICSSLFENGDKVLIQPGTAFIWLRETPYSYGRVVNTIRPTASPNLQVINGTPAWDGYQNWFYVAPIGNIYASGWVEQASLLSTFTPFPVTPAANNWNVPLSATITRGIPYAWIRAQASSYAGTLATLFQGTVFTVMGSPAPVFDRVQWWWPVHFVYPNGSSTVIVDGWLEQNAIKPLTTPNLTPIVLPTGTPATTQLRTSTTVAAFEAFERGYMVWTGYDQLIYVFYGTNGGQVLSYPVNAYVSLPANPVIDPIPFGKVKPVSGFGQVWGNISAVRQGLGWALQPEQGYTATVTFSNINYTQSNGPGMWITLPDGRTFIVNRSTWYF